VARSVTAFIRSAGLEACWGQYNHTVRYKGLPGAELIEAGIADLDGRETIPSLVVSIGAPR
jgi:hypothetical protein